MLYTYGYMFKGRLGIKQYWLGTLLLLVFYILTSSLLAATFFLVILPLFTTAGAPGGLLGALLFVTLGSFLAFVIPGLIILPFSIGLHIRRLHDIGLSGWLWLVFPLTGWISNFLFPPYSYAADGSFALSPSGLTITAVLSLLLIVLMSWPSTKGPNKYGEPQVYPSLWAAIRGKKPVVETPAPPVPVVPATPAQ